MNVVVCGQVKSENSSLPVTVRVSKTCLLKLPNIELARRGDNILPQNITRPIAIIGEKMLSLHNVALPQIDTFLPKAMQNFHQLGQQGITEISCIMNNSF